ncbi:unnamed protein product [Mytilus edulis]|uniref:Uncharacterized protein n=1 Tax=Mytilus edulis TaxID=6550 RepID=A0A8S3TST3_MYTED|nr:unnamed protein product [Mytilus edulis]
MYVCVSGINKEETNESFFDYIEAKSRGYIHRSESLRTVDEPEHAVVVFAHRIDIAELKGATRGNLSLEFNEADPPRRIIARVIEVLKDTNVKITDSKVVISVMYNCEHGTFWDTNQHRVVIPGPFKPKVSDSYIRSFIIDIASVCNEQLAQHHAYLTFKDELYIECNIDQKDKAARCKVKDWKNLVQKALDEFVNNSVKSRHLQITSDTQGQLLEHIKKTKAQYKSEELKSYLP